MALVVGPAGRLFGAVFVSQADHTLPTILVADQARGAVKTGSARSRDTLTVLAHLQDHLALTAVTIATIGATHTAFTGRSTHFPRLAIFDLAYFLGVLSDGALGAIGASQRDQQGRYTEHHIDIPTHVQPPAKSESSDIVAPSNGKCKPVGEAPGGEHHHCYIRFHPIC